MPGEYDLDPAYRYPYLKEFTLNSPGGRSQTSLDTRTYQDTNGDQVPDRITRGLSLNGRVWTSAQDILTGTVTGVSPLGRTVTWSYNPATLLAQSVSVGGLHSQSYGYDTRGRLISVAAGTRTATLDYDADGNVASWVAPDQKRLRFSYDPVGRLLTQTRPDNTLLRFDYDPNGN